MAGLSDYLDRLRELIPARTFALYILGTGLVSGIADSPEVVASEYGWLLLLVTGVCLAVNIVGRIIEKKGWADCLISSVAFLMLTLTQRFTGPLAAVGIDSKGAYVAATFLAAVYVTMVTMIQKPAPPNAAHRVSPRTA